MGQAVDFKTKNIWSFGHIAERVIGRRSRGIQITLEDVSQSLFEELLDKISLLIQAQNALRTPSQPSSRRLKPHVEGLHVRSCLCADSAAQSHCSVVAKSSAPCYFHRCSSSSSLGRTALPHNQFTRAVSIACYRVDWSCAVLIDRLNASPDRPVIHYSFSKLFSVIVLT